MTRLATARTHPSLHRKGLALAAVSALLVLAGCGSDSGDGDATADDTSSASTSASASGSASASASGSPTTSASPSDDASDPAPDPVSSPIVDKAVKGAIKAGFPALVPAGVPDGWTVESARFTGRGGGSWEIRLTAPGGPVTLTQDTSALADHMGQAYGSAQGAGSVDVSGTGSWKGYTGGDGSALGKSLAGTSAVLVGPDQATLVTLAEQLLTAEDSGNGSGDG